MTSYSEVKLLIYFDDTIYLVIFSQKLEGFPHHTAVYVCCTILSGTARARILASSLSFTSLCICLENEDSELLDYVKVG